MARERAPTDSEASERIQVAKAILDDHATMSIAMVRAGEPWAAKVFFVEDEPEGGRLDLCCALLMTSRKRSLLQQSPRMAFVVAGDLPDRWIQGIGSAVVVEDDADAAAVMKRLEEKSPAAGPFLRAAGSTAVRIRVDLLKVTDLSATPPIAEFTFA